jgi:hypothetical protein
MYTTAEAGSCVSYWHAIYQQLPISRIIANNDIFNPASGLVTYLMLGCDSDDPNGIFEHNQEFASSLTTATAADVYKGAWMFESVGQHGHHFSEADAKLALQWFSEITVNGQNNKGEWLTDARETCWIRTDEIALQSSGGFLHYAGHMPDYAVTPCTDFVGGWNPGESVEIVQSFMTQVVSAKYKEQKEMHDDMMSDATYAAEYTASKQAATTFKGELALL